MRPILITRRKFPFFLFSTLIAILLLGVLCYLSFRFFFEESSEEIILPKLSPASIKEVKSEYATECLPFKLDSLEEKKTLIALDLQNEIEWIKSPKHPFLKGELFVFSGSQVPVRIAPEKPYYLSYKENSLVLSERKTPLKLTLTGNGLKIEMDFQWKELSPLQETLLLSLNSLKKSELTAPSSELLGLQTQMQQFLARSPDLFFKYYGKDLYHELGKAYRLENLQGEFFFLRENSVYTLEENSSLSLSEACPVGAYIFFKEAKADHLVFYLWNQEGNQWVFLKKPLCGADLTESTLTSLSDTFRIRSLNKVSFRESNRLKILRKGDWMVYGDGGWKLIKSADEMEALLNYKLPGNLFVFDGLQKLRDKIQLTGHLFDTSRTCVKPINLSLQEKRGKKSAPSPINSLQSKPKSRVNRSVKKI